MRSLDLRGVARALVVAPHPDDETIGAFGLIRRLRDRGAKVRVIVTTDGAASHRNSTTWPAARLSRERRQESRRMMRRAGVPISDIRFLDWPDGRLDRLDGSALRRLTRQIGGGPVPDLLVLPSPHDNHPDHRAVARAASRAWPRRVRRLFYLVWPQDGRRRPSNRYMLRLGSRQAMKRAAVRGYRSQTGLIADDPDGFRLTPNMIARFSRPLELFAGAR